MTLTGQTIGIPAEGYMTIQTIKSIIYRSRFNIPVDSQILYYSGTQLNNNSTLLQNNINNGDTIHVKPRLGGC